MQAALTEWLNLLLRWAHVMAGIAWIGTSFHFVWLDQALRRRAGRPEGIAGETWMVHGGGFYLAEKYVVAPERLPEELHWFKWEAYLTWLTGFLLLAVVYYLGAEALLIDRAKLALAPWQAVALSAGSLAAGWLVYDRLCRWIGDRTAPLAAGVFALIAAATVFYAAVFGDRAAFLHVGAFIGTLMAGSVFFVIIPNQKKVVADLIAGRAPDPALGKAAKQRSLHNNYLTLPVVFMMISGHYPLVFGHRWSAALALAIVVAGALVRHYFNRADAGRLDWSARAALPAALVLVAGLAALTAYRPEQPAASAAPVGFAEAQAIVARRCLSCHAAEPSHPDFAEAPRGVTFDGPGEIAAQAAQIAAQAVLTDAMPPGNVTAMTQAERAALGAWIARGAPPE